MTDRPPSDNDGVTLLAFADRPELDRTLGATSYTIDVASGALLEADVFFNAAFPWSVAPAGQAGRFDLESIATHEIGHLLGLGHSALGETEVVGTGRRVLSAGAVMFPIAFSPGNIDGRRLQPDDIAGASDIYPDGTFRESTGSVSGRVTKNGLGVFGAHVVAMHLRSGALVGTFTLDDSGAFVLAGLEPGPVVLRVEPLDDGDVTSFIESQQVDLDFRVAFSTTGGLRAAWREHSRRGCSGGGQVSGPRAGTAACVAVAYPLVVGGRRRRGPGSPRRM